MAQYQSELQPCGTDHSFLTQQGCMVRSDASLITTSHPHAVMHTSHMLMSRTSVFQREALAKLKTLALCLPFYLKSLAGRGVEEKDSCSRGTCHLPIPPLKRAGSQASFSRIDGTCSCTLSCPSYPLGSSPMPFLPLK